jgi:predicted Zn-dependent protease
MLKIEKTKTYELTILKSSNLSIYTSRTSYLYILRIHILSFNE